MITPRFSLFQQPRLHICENGHLPISDYLFPLAEFKVDFLQRT